MSSPMLAMVAASEGCLSHLTSCLGPTPLARFEVVCRSILNAFSDECVWVEHFQHALPCFEIGGELLESIARARSRDERRRAKAALGRLVKLDFPMVVLMPLIKVEVAHRLGGGLRNAISVANKHINSGGYLAVAAAMCIRFRDVDRVANAPPVLGHWQAGNGNATDPEGFVISEPGTVRVPTTIEIESSTGDVQLRSGFFDVHVRLAYLNTKIMVSAFADVSNVYAVDPVVDFDLSCLEPDFYLHTRSMTLRLNGEWKEVNGLRSTAPSPGHLSAVMAAGLTCVLSFRDFLRPRKRVFKVIAGLAAFNLESLNLRSQ